jgi:hypothetical protein
MVRANEAKVSWDPHKKRWHVVIQVGAEVIKRDLPKDAADGDESLRTMALATAKDEGYDLDAAQVSIVR